MNARLPVGRSGACWTKDGTRMAISNTAASLTSGLKIAKTIAAATGTAAVIGGGAGMYMGLGKEPPAKDGVSGADKRSALRMSLVGGLVGVPVGILAAKLPASVPVLGGLGKMTGPVAGVLAGVAAVGAYNLAEAYFN
jgi:hypothetical protein